MPLAILDMSIKANTVKYSLVIVDDVGWMIVCFALELSELS